MRGAAVLDRSGPGTADQQPDLTAPGGRGSAGCAGFVLSAVQVLVLRALVGSKNGLTAGELAASTAAARTLPIAPAVTALEARSLAHGHERSSGARKRAEWAWSLTVLGRHTAEAMRVVDGFGLVVEVGDRRLAAAEAGNR